MLQNEEPSNANWLVPVMVQGVWTLALNAGAQAPFFILSFIVN